MNRLVFVLCLAAVVLAVLGGFYFRHTARKEKAARLAAEVKTRHATHSRDSLRALHAETAAWAKAQEREAQATRTKQTATRHYETIRRTPAATWKPTAVDSFLSVY